MRSFFLRARQERKNIQLLREEERSKLSRWVFLRVLCNSYSCSEKLLSLISCGCWKKVSTHANEVPMQKKCNQLFSLVSNQRKANDMLALHWPLSTVAGNLMVLTAEYFVGTETPFVSKKKLEYPNNIYTVWSTA